MFLKTGYILSEQRNIYENRMGQAPLICREEDSFFKYAGAYPSLEQGQK